MRSASPALVHVALTATVSATEGLVEERDVGPGTGRCMTVHNPRNPNEHVSLVFGYDYDPKSGHLRGYATMRASFIGTHVEVDSIIADDRDQILEATSGTSPFGLLAIETNTVVCGPQ